MKIDEQVEDSLVEVPERIGYYALMLAILEDYSASKALRYIRKGKAPLTSGESED